MKLPFVLFVWRYRITYSCGDGARFWSSHPSRSSRRKRTRRPSRVTPGICCLATNA
jgi:hypothetical protein